METAQWQKLDITNFNIFIRDLSSSMNINLKHMIEDMDKQNIQISQTKHKKRGKKQPMKKKDIIIQQQNEIRKKKFLEEDKLTCKFLLQNLNDNNPYLNFEKLKTDEGKFEYKFQLLERYWSQKKKYLSHVFNLYFHLKHVEKDKLSENRQKIMNTIDSILNNYDYKLYLFENLGHLLPPLNFWDKGELQFDQWQQDTIRKIKKNISIIAKAPTSSGKTFISMSAGILYNKVLYVCPSKPVAYQLGANFIKMGYKVYYLIENHTHLSYDNKTNIFIGTPDIIEKYIYKIGIDFDYVVYDEIHNMNIYYENLIKLIPCNFIALSATIQNIHCLKEKFESFYPKKRIEYIEYSKRFINQQRWIWDSVNNKIQKIHPCSCLEDNFDSFNEISFTPNDCAVLFNKLVDEFEDYDDSIEERLDLISPDNYFKDDKLLTLDDSKQYETIIKQELKTIHSLYPEKTKTIIQSFHKEVQIDNYNFIPFLKQCKDKNILPMILFHTDEEITKEIFNLLNHQLYEQEKKEYPFHYIILDKKKEFYENYLIKREVYSDSIRIRTKDPETEKREKMTNFDATEKNNYLMTMIDFYNNCIEKCEKNNSELQIQNLEKELADFIESPDFRMPDQFRKHQEFCFTQSSPMSANEIRSIRREIRKNTGITIDYEDPLFQLLKRGIGMYIQSMPDEYNWIVQRLMSQKKLGIVISDKTLCLGIDLPIRSVCFTGYKNPQFTKEDYLQMSGRAGRRGHDNQGNIIFHNITNYKELMRGELPELKFQNQTMNSSYSILQQLNPKISLQNIKTNEITNEITSQIDLKSQKLLWYLRYYNKSEQFIMNLNKYEKELFMTNEREREYHLFTLILKSLLNLEDKDNKEYLSLYKQNKLSDQKEKHFFIELGNIYKDIINSLHSMKYKIIVETSSIIFQKIKSFYI